jgi:multicomponent Na+:H+ antiporter subunit D
MTASLLVTAPLLLPLAGALAAAPMPRRMAARLALGVSVLTLGAGLLLVRAAAAGGPQVYSVGGWPAPYGIVLVADLLGATLAVIAAGVAVAATLHTLTARTEGTHHRLYQPLFLLLLSALGGAFTTGDLFNLYVFMELAILSSLPLVAMADRAVSPEVTFKYAVLAALGSAMLLAGIALTYAAFGTLNMADIAERARTADALPAFWHVAAAVIIFAFLLKCGVAPFHFWLPDAHSAAPATISAMLSGVLVKLGLYGVIRTATLLFPDAPALAVLGPLGAASAVLGALAALANPDLKRLLAYSTVANMGLIVMVLGWGGQAGTAAALLHAVHHALVKGSLFLSVGYVTETLHEHRIARLGGLAQVTPGGALAFGVGALALAGLPPLGMFISKLMMLRAGQVAGDPTLVTLVAVTSALAIGYAVRPFVGVYWGEPPSAVTTAWRAHPPGHPGPVAPLALLGASLILALTPLADFVSTIAAELQAPGIYIAAVLGERR